MGIPTVAVYSEPDMAAKHVRMADEAICVGPAASSESYLVIEKIMDAIEKTGADAVHPGYGFLSENKLFARELERAGVEFLGPNEHAIHSMGDKIESMRIAEAAGVSCAKRFDGECDTVEHAREIADGIGYPIIMKASAGGGGKGMRIAWSEQELEEGFNLARAEAASSFGDDRMLIQQFVCPYESRHIEIQLVGDKHGNYAAFPERECSIQRRAQKVIEESPSVLLNDETRLKMQEQAIMLAKDVGYHSAGTVEFIADNEQNFYFLEMNTRLQVEHPVTEEVTGVDLVELMIRVAAGEQLPEHLRGPVPFEGWAMESRVYAEDPLRNFLPSIGQLTSYAEPTTAISTAVEGSDADDASRKVRVDSGVTQGSQISMFYDPMISKTITKAATRKDAISLMAAALDTYIIRGVQNNVSFCRALCEHPKFLEGDISTDFIKDEYPEGFSVPELKNELRREVFVAALEMLSVAGHPGTADHAPGVCYVGVAPAETAQVLNMDMTPVSYDGLGRYEFDAAAFDDAKTANDAVVQVEDVVYEGSYDPLFFGVFSHKGAEKNVVAQFVRRLPQGVRVQVGGSEYDIAVLTPAEHEASQHMIAKEEIDTSKTLLSPMPGLLVSVAVEPGTAVEPGQELAVVEAMKMQNVLRAESKSVVKEVRAAPGDSLEVDQIIVEFE